METTNKSAEKPVVAPVSAPKVKINGACAAWINAISSCGAIFFGTALMFDAIAGFTKSWSFGIPFISVLRSYSIAYGGSSIALAILFVLCGIVSLLSIKKMTELKAIEKAYCVMFKVFLGITILLAIDMLSQALYSLFGLGKKSGVSHKTLWLNGFLPTTIMAGVSCAIAMLSRAIAKGKTQIVRVMSIIAISVVSAAFILVIVQTFVGFYGKSSKSSYGLDDLDDVLNFFK